MEGIARVFTFPPMVPVYLLIAGWLLAWLVAWVLSSLIVSGDADKVGWIDVTVYNAWTLALGVHLVAVVIVSTCAISAAFGWGLIGWLQLQDNKVALLAYLAIALVDVVLVLSVLKHRQISESVPH